MHREVILTDEKTFFLPESTDFPIGLLFGYSVYTTLRLPIADEWLSAHFNRLENDVHTMGLNWRYTHDQLQEAIHQCFQQEEPVIRLSAFANVNGYGDFYSGQALPCRLLLSTRPVPLISGSGLSLQSIEYERTLPAIKLGAMADLIYRKRQARQARFEDVLLINRQGNISEASTANIFLIQDNTLHTPDPHRDGCLPGITRLQVLQAAQQAGLTVQSDSPLSLKDACTADGAFLCNAAQGIIPVQRIDQTSLPWPPSATEIVRSLREQPPLNSFNSHA